MAVIPTSTGDLSQGNILVSNFNNKRNQQGTGTTIVEVTPKGKTRVFATFNKNLPGCPGGVGLTTALTALRSGWVVVGSLPTKGGGMPGMACATSARPGPVGPRARARRSPEEPGH